MHRLLALITAGVLATPIAGVSPASAAETQPASAAVSRGQRVFVCGHSFHVFIAHPLELLARESGRRDHQNLGVFFIGGSYPIQHWEAPDEKNPAKIALSTGQVNVLTLACNRTVPDAGIDRFADLAFAKNPAGRVMVQFSWFPKDNREEQSAVTDFDKRSVEDLESLEKQVDEYLVKQRAQVKAINERHGREHAFIVPISPALTRLRKEILAGKVPGLTKQSQLFRDPGGHAAKPLENLVTFCWFAAVYRESPEGLTALDNPGDDASKTLNRVLQKLAWEAMLAEPMSGVKRPAEAK